MTADDLRDLPLIERKRRLAKLVGKAKRRAIRFTEHLTGDGPTVGGADRQHPAALARVDLVLG